MEVTIWSTETTDFTAFYELLLENKDALAKIVTAEKGKATGDATGEVLFSASFFEWFSEEDARIYGDVIPHSTPTSRIQVIKKPVGVCGPITPWNFPTAMGARKIAAALQRDARLFSSLMGSRPFTTALAVLVERAGLP